MAKVKRPPVIKVKLPAPERVALLARYQHDFIEAGCDEAGRGCLAGPVFAAAVILPADFEHSLLNDSKQMCEADRYLLRTEIEQKALAFAVASVSNTEIDEINILNASFLAMHRAIDALHIRPEFLIIDGNRFNKYEGIPHQCVIQGDGKYFSIAAASVLAKTYRDDYMMQLALEHPEYDWHTNKGYPTIKHRNTVLQLGFTPHHRRTFNVTNPQLSIF
ncbi:ribonuclease HII [Mucilaginibacter aquatilis]|uniref:Ribonuclease HII n=1 Tax=Mucilaginibacter aquatilis TaxID=1517760 RepID=A0A6I4IQR7_9SPHI|nr:ribonuclease HII [Mucilaginibacter aquatilis]MVN92173.1 ribonuclease HII [Mucilaginibacter aquatilis]